MHQRISAQIKRFFLILPALLSVSCSTSVRPNNAIIMRLKDRGPVPVSKDNPYLAANSLITKEAETNEEFKGFLKHRGNPNALKVSKNVFEPLMMDFYYTDRRELFTLEDSQGIWLINGPYHIDQEKLLELEKIIDFDAQKPVSVITASPTPEVIADAPAVKSENIFKDTSIQKQPVIEKLQKAPEKPQPKLTQPTVALTPKPVFTPKVVEVAKVNKNVAPGDFTSLPIKRNNDEAQNALRSKIKELVDKNGSHPAELTPKGDLVHHVVSDNENLADIAKWYTFDANNSEKIARINQTTTKSKLNVGDLVIVPSYLIKNKARLLESSTGKF